MESNESDLFIWAVFDWTPRKRVLEGAVKKKAVVERIGGEADWRGHADDQLRVVRHIECIARPGRNQRGQGARSHLIGNLVFFLRLRLFVFFLSPLADHLGSKRRNNGDDAVRNKASGERH